MQQKMLVQALSQYSLSNEWSMLVMNCDYWRFMIFELSPRAQNPDQTLNYFQYFHRTVVRSYNRKLIRPRVLQALSLCSSFKWAKHASHKLWLYRRVVIFELFPIYAKATFYAHNLNETSALNLWHIFSQLTLLHSTYIHTRVLEGSIDHAYSRRFILLMV